MRILISLVGRFHSEEIATGFKNFNYNVGKINTNEIFNYVKNNFSTESYSQRYLNFIKKIKP